MSSAFPVVIHHNEMLERSNHRIHGNEHGRGAKAKLDEVALVHRGAPHVVAESSN